MSVDLKLYFTDHKVTEDNRPIEIMEHAVRALNPAGTVTLIRRDPQPITFYDPVAELDIVDCNVGNGQELSIVTNRHGNLVRWSKHPDENGPVDHYLSVNLSLHGRSDPAEEFDSFVKAMDGPLCEYAGWIENPQEGTCYPHAPSQPERSD